MEKLEVQKELLEFSIRILSEIEEFCNNDPAVNIRDFKSFLDTIFNVYDEYVKAVKAGGLTQDFLPVAIHFLRELNSHASYLLTTNKNSKIPEGEER